MAKVIDKKINKEINNGLGINYVTGNSHNIYTLPSFEVNEKGEYQYVGTQTISSLAEYSEYMKKYSAIAKYIKQNYSSVISRIYKNALNSLIASKERYNISKNDYSLMNKVGKTFTVSSLNEERNQNYEQMLNYVTKAAYQTRRLKPNSEIVNILANAENSFTDRDRFYVLPQINDNGVVLKQKKNNMNFLEAQFDLVSEADAKAIENFMLETANSLDKSTAESVKAQIVKIFDASKKAGNNIKNGVTNNVINELTELTSNMVDLVGVDLSSYEKKPRKSHLSNDFEQTNVKPSFDPTLGDDPLETPANTTPNSFNSNEILIRGTFKTSPALEGDVIVTKITPEGVKFSVTFDGNKLFVVNEKQEDVPQGPEM